LEKKEHAKKKKYRKRKRKPNKQTHVLKEKHGQHIQNQGPKQTTRNAHAADKDVCK
jgi:hypothetical protein